MSSSFPIVHNAYLRVMEEYFMCLARMRRDDDDNGQIECADCCVYITNFRIDNCEELWGILEHFNTKSEYFGLNC